MPGVFFDSNVLLYLLSADATRADRAEALLARGGHISVQVLNEFASVATRKLGMTLIEVREVLATVRALCTVYIEGVRGVPLVSVLFTASFLFPLFLPAGSQIDVLLRVVAGMTLFSAAYMAEVIRGGLQAVPRGQVEAAQALGLSWWQTQRRVVLPQALAAVLPGLMNNFIAIFKDTSLVTIVSLYELTGALSLALNSDADWRPYKLEAYLFIAAIYFVFCHALSRYSGWVEGQLARGR